MTERLWAFVVVASFYGGTVFERKWWRWHRNSKAVAIEDWELARDTEFVDEVKRAVERSVRRTGRRPSE